MKPMQRRLVVAAAAALVLVPSAALGQAGGGGGSGSLYSDLVVTLRAVDGTPILTSFEVPVEGGPATNEYCVQPISYTEVPGVDVTTNPVDGRDVWLVPLMGELSELPDAEEVEVCDPQTDYVSYVSEVELERLNLVRTSPDVLARKLADVEARLVAAGVLTLDGAGRLTTDGVPIDASPEHAAIYQEIMRTGTIPGLEGRTDAQAGPPAQVGVLDAWKLAAASMGSAAGKYVPLTVDAVQYYHRIIPFPASGYVAPTGWPMSFLQSQDPDASDGVPVPAEQFVDFDGFSYTRSALFTGSVTWLHVPSLTWQVSRILDVVDFGNLTAMDDIDDVELTGVLGYAQMVDDVRAVILYLHENEVIEGFYLDVIGEDTTDEQIARLDTGDIVNRTGGYDRFDTAILLSQERFVDDGAGAVVLVRADLFPDGLAAVPLADKLHAPLLLTSTIHNDRVMDEVERVLPDGGNVVLVGGSGAVPLSIETAYSDAGFDVVRYEGTDRYGTAVAVAEGIGAPASIMLATGADFPDALSGGPAAAHMNGVVILTNGTSMPAVSATYLSGHNVPTYALGGPAAAAAPAAQAIVGSDRYETAALVATEFFEFPFGVGVASGENFPDALAGGADAAAQTWPLLLTPKDVLASPAAAFISDHESVMMVDVYGGLGVISDDVVVDLYDAMR